MTTENTLTSDKYELISIISDMHKDAYGYRDRSTDYSNATIAELEAQIDAYQVIINEEIEFDKIRKEANIKAFKELLTKTIGLGANDNSTALKWLFDGTGIGIDSFNPTESFIYHYGLDNSKYGNMIERQLEIILCY